MMNPAKIVIIGAGSASFGPSTLATILRSRRLRGSTLGLVDLDAGALQRVVDVAARMNQAWDGDMSIAGATDRRELLAGADFVVVSIEVPPREKLWRLDWEITTRHGLRQPYGENGGPGGMAHTMRQVPPLLELARDMEALCPDAWLINFSNPLPRLTRALTKYSKIRTVGKCHQIEVGYAIVAALLGADYGLILPAELSLHSGPENLALVHRLAAFGRQHFALKAAGLNHFTWMVDVRDRETGEDLYPHMRRVAQDPPPTLEPMSMDLFRIFDLCPVPGDTHLAEYLPWTHDPLARPWERYDLRLYDWSANETRRREREQQQLAIGRGERSPDELRETPSEGAVELIEAIQGNLNYYDEAVNIANNGAIPNLPADTIVEVPGFVSSMGVRGIQMDPLPEPIAELLRREAALVELVVDAAASGDRRLALQALLFDPMINDVARAEAILDDYLQTFASQLPQFS